MKQLENILLVGEGNFSFSVSLCDQVDSPTRIIATCYESEERILKDGSAVNNIQRLREKGAEVYFEVDCTRLRPWARLGSKPFDCIIFNFPHCGRKAGVKKNRDLLAKFFISCADILAEKGEVHVALCKGQGGTPADQPMREWHNSWQVVAMAAGAGFLLSEVQPFSVSKYSGYNSTGYRSQSKPFHVEGALNHVFTRSLPISFLKPLDMKIEVENKSICIQVPEELVDKINRNFLDEDSCHPVNAANKQFLQEISKVFPVQRLKSALPYIVKGNTSLPSLCSLEVSQFNLYWVQLKDEEISAQKGKDSLNASKPADVSAFVSGLSLKDGDPEKPGSGPWEAEDKVQNIDDGYCFRPSLTTHVQDVLKRPDFRQDTLYALNGLVFRKCLVSAYTMPVFHETVLIYGFKDGDAKSRLIQLLSSSLNSAFACLIKSISNLAENGLTGKRSGLVEKTDFIGIKSPNERDYFIHFNNKVNSSCSCNLPVGNLTVTPCGQLHNELNICVASINLDLLSMIAFDIHDWRIMWTFDERFINQFKQLELKVFKNFSLYPPCFVHDASFWVEAGKSLDEIELHTLARRVAGETVKDITLIDSFQHPETGGSSWCYRLTYQSCDRALSCQKASELQLLLRLQIQKNLGVTLR
ncbi:ferredoxin-fold anticodon-binding domain-containing protein 1 [Latimeria chalumnae]|uniref:ferredoxin-fold anticodon-binding domain-containing protein 1 n=1 Tax=Latimeria chalumnae TaxID=7897 RepID=UPI0006D8DACD|nr:PREDICTED: ferredoxin-fold anticodon-binding domain-containing protein 1 [Latimeria chalumnae]|eukprot:XP_014345701.1 PREDICTED: ferredoxin-fold anticodon-binding domain-containing protein 1 [Latimeria chalumnae]